jgi:hypothetical protein
MVATISGLTASEVFGQNATASNQTQATGQQNTTNATSTQAAAPNPVLQLGMHIKILKNFLDQEINILRSIIIS